MNISEIIETKINNAQYCTVFIASDFLSIASYDTTRKILSRLSNKNIIKKIIRGMYYKPKFSSLLNEYVDPNINLVVDSTYDFSIDFVFLVFMLRLSKVMITRQTKANSIC